VFVSSESTFGPVALFRRIMLTIGPSGFSAVESLNAPATSPQSSGQSGTGSASQTPPSGQTGSK